jgi:hypothetical protein
MMKKLALGLSLTAGVSMGAQAAPVTYDFTATVTGDDFNACGNQMVGTFTYDTQPTAIIYEDSFMRHYRDETPSTTLEIHCDYGSVVIEDSSVVRMGAIIDMNGMLQLEANTFDGVLLQSLPGYNVEGASVGFSEINNTSLGLPEQLPELGDIENKSIYIGLQNTNGIYGGVYAEITSLSLSASTGSSSSLASAQLDIDIQAATTFVPVGAGVPVDYRLISKPELLGPATIEHWASVVRPDGVELPLDLPNSEPMEQGWVIDRVITFRTEPYWPAGEYTLKIHALQTSHTSEGDGARFSEGTMTFMVE